MTQMHSGQFTHHSPLPFRIMEEKCSLSELLHAQVNSRDKLGLSLNRKQKHSQTDRSQTQRHLHMSVCVWGGIRRLRVPNNIQTIYFDLYCSPKSFWNQVISYPEDVSKLSFHWVAGTNYRDNRNGIVLSQ